MPDKSCPNHPESEMVPCLGCGRDFCSICYPIRGAGQYCPSCYENSLEQISEKKPAPVLGKISQLRDRKKTARSEKTGADRQGVEAARRERKFAGLGGVRAGTMGKGRAPAGELPEELPGKAKKAATTGGGWTTSLPGRLIMRPFAFAKEHFPLAIVDTRRGEGMPPLAAAWHKLLPVVVGGAVAWTIMVSLAHRRVGWHTWIVAAVIAAFVVWSFGLRFDLPAAIVTMMLTLLSLVMGEVLVHVLFSLKLIKTLDLGYPQPAASAYFRDFLYRILVNRMLPSALIAFLIGLWPLPKRIGWRGFKRSEKGSEKG
jgi:hypothetical protein